MNTILVVEDSRLVRTLLEKDLIRAGYQVLTSADGEHGLRSAQQQHPDLIILDMLLPKIGGLEVLNTLRADDKTKNIPVIVLTGLSKGNAERLRDQGATAFFEKSDQNLKEGAANLIRLVAQVMANSPSVRSASVP